MANSVDRGSELLELIVSPAARSALSDAADNGVPPVTAISTQVMSLLGAQASQNTTLRQFIGTAVKGVLEEEGYEVAKDRVRVTNDGLFRSGAAYRRRSEPGVAADVLERFLGTLTQDEVLRAIKMLQRRLNGD